MWGPIGDDRELRANGGTGPCTKHGGFSDGAPEPCGTFRHGRWDGYAHQEHCYIASPENDRILGQLSVFMVPLRPLYSIGIAAFALPADFISRIPTTPSLSLASEEQ